MVEQDILAPYAYLDSLPGKNLRSGFVDALNSVLEAPEAVATDLKHIVNQLHIASLLMDDIEDDAVLRRGKPTAHRIFGMPRTLNAANLVMLSSLREACQRFPEAQHAIFEELLLLHRGQGSELFWRDTHTCPSEQEYTQMVLSKTGGLYRIIAKVLNLYAKNETHADMIPLVNCFALLYQIQDDLLNLTSTIYEQKKGFAEDISEGKFSFPVVHCLHTNTRKAHELRDILALHTQDKHLKELAVDILENAGSVLYTRTTLDKLDKEARRHINALPNRGSLLEFFDKVIHRS